MNNDKDYLDELGVVALGSRLKRLSESVMGDAMVVYKYMGQNMQPKWFTLISLLHDKKSMSIVRAAKSLGLTQPCISQYSNELIKLGLVKVTADNNDRRRKVMSLTAKGESKYQKLLPIKLAIEKAAISICAEVDQNFYLAIQQFEKALMKKSLYQRALENYHE